MDIGYTTVNPHHPKSNSISELLWLKIEGFSTAMFDYHRETG
jgi:hypothetical protein